MSEDPKVQVTSEPGLKSQFGKGRLSYQSSMMKVSKPVAAGSCAVLTIAIGAVVMSGNPKKNQSDQASHFLGVSFPQTLPPAVETLNIPQADARLAPTPAPTGNGRGRSQAKFLGPQVVSRPRNVPIPSGSMASATLISGASDGLVKAELKEPLSVAGETLLEAGTVLVGSGQSGNDRLIVRFTKAVFRDGATAKVAAEAADVDDKIPGLKGSRIGYRAAKLVAGIGLNFVGGLSQGLQSTQGQFGAVVAPPTMKNALLNGAARASIKEGQDLMNEYRSEKPVIEVGAGTSIIVLFSDTGSD